MAAQPERTGVLILRVWIEDDAQGGMRARITQTLDIRAPASVVTWAASAEEITDTVARWLHSFLSVSVAEKGP
jgi:hypothetical protein